ncbi:6-phosphogluconolactonase [Thiomicrospira aerophila AL3]|uniref:6-phosphogluconolactonase n=1 Tax=Thiomicrospira aerophila AL3 TaxID=717772 RepID=W0DS48_9GAMM|nr:6-phosphogluconolactonase [Thiomicrospira aerophila]AHF01267.1 6-phosphogluconolactonase [Thiomicrospira aerophila AL3]
MPNSLPSLPDGWQVFQDTEQLAQQVAQDISRAAIQAIAERGAFHLVTAGGRTPNRVYQLLAQSQQAWSHWHIYMGDERQAPVADQQRNATALYQYWLDKVTIPDNQIHLMHTDWPIAEALADYQQQVAGVKFDLTLLGMGEDGHTASLFPNQAWRSLKGDVALIVDSPKPPPVRLTLTLAKLNESKRLIKLITGQEKHPAVLAWLAGNGLPIAAPTGVEATMTYLDESAWSGC